MRIDPELIHLFKLYFYQANFDRVLTSHDIRCLKIDLIWILALVIGAQYAQ